MSTLPEVAATATIAGVVGARIICTTTLILLLHSWYGLHLESVKRKKSYIHTNVVGEQCWIETSFYFIFWNKKKYATNSDKYCTYYKPCLGLCDFFSKSDNATLCIMYIVYLYVCFQNSFLNGCSSTASFSPDPSINWSSIDKDQQESSEKWGLIVPRHTGGGVYAKSRINLKNKVMKHLPKLKYYVLEIGK